MIIERGIAEMPASTCPTVVTGRVTPVRYENAMLRGAVGSYLGQCTSDDVLAAVLWAAETNACRWAIEDMAAHQQWLSGWVEHFERKLSGERRASIQRESTAELTRVLADLRSEYDLVKRVHDQAEELFTQLRQSFGADPVDLMGSPRQESEANTIYALAGELAAAIVRADRSITAYKSARNRLVALAERREAFSVTKSSLPMEQHGQLDGPFLERLTAWLLERDGLTVLRSAGGPGDQGVDILGRLPTGELVAIQSKYRHRKPIEPQTVYELNGTARQLHGAEYAIVVTNSRFTEQARRDADTLGIRLIDGEDLKVWATWGDALYDIADIPVDQPAPEPEPQLAG